MSSPSRTRILDAALRVVARDGAAHLVLDEVAAEAGLSKGGLLHHFPSKHALLEALVDRYIDHANGQGERLRGDPPPGAPNARLRAAAAALSDPAFGSDLDRAMLVAVVNEPALLERITHRRSTSWQQILQDQPDPAGSALLLLALEGWKLFKALGVDPQVDRSLLPGGLDVLAALQAAIDTLPGPADTRIDTAPAMDRP